MEKKIMVKKKILIVLVLSFVPMLANATNGYFVHGHGMESRAMAGAGVALPHGAISGAHNPAAGVHIGNRIDFSAAFFIPQRDYESSPSAAMGMGGAFTIGPNDISSDQELFVIPNFGINKILNEKSSIGLAIYGHGGMNTVWHGGTATFDPDGPGPAPVSTLPGTYGGGTAGVDLSHGFIAPTYSSV
jgi:long-chain fatty acid transport protein